MTNRKSLIPSEPPHEGNPEFKTRRIDVRREVSEKITMKRLAPAVSAGETNGSATTAVDPGASQVVATESYDGWALNISRGGVRAVVEKKVSLGDEFEVTVGAETPLTRRGRVVWVQEEKDGMICGVEFLNASGQHRLSTMPPAPRASVAPPPPAKSGE